MPPNAPQDPHADSKKEGIDPKSLLLPKKEVPGTTPQSAQRINAGALLEQEQMAAAEDTPKSTETPLAASAPKKEEPMVQPLETYKGDIEKLVQDKNVSVVSIAAAEAERRSAAGAPEEKKPGSGDVKKKLGRFGMVLGGIVLLAIAGGLAWYFFAHSNTVNGPAAAAAIPSPFISVDGTQVIAITPDQSSRSEVMTNLEAAKESVSLSLGLIERLLPATASTTAGQNATAMDAPTFLSLLAPDIPPDLLLTIQPSFLLGVHVYNDNQPLLILSVDSYEQAYAGMLAWEPTMQQDLSPLFDYTPSPHIPEENIATSTATTSDQLIQTGFVDAIVENHDARVLENSTGDIYFLWTFLDRNTLVITTNDATLREIISRLQNAPVTPIPGQ